MKNKYLFWALFLTPIVGLVTIDYTNKFAIYTLYFTGCSYFLCALIKGKLSKGDFGYFTDQKFWKGNNARMVAVSSLVILGLSSLGIDIISWKLVLISFFPGILYGVLFYKLMVKYPI